MIFIDQYRVAVAFSPLDLAQLEAWWDGNDPDGDGTTPAPQPSPWVDKSVNSHNLTTNTGGSASWVANQLNGLGVIRLNGTNGGFDDQAPFIYALGTPEIWAVVKSAESGIGTIIAEGTHLSVNAVYRLYDKEDTDDFVFDMANNTVDRFVNTQDRGTGWQLVIATDFGAATGTNLEVVDVDAGTTGTYTRDAPTFTRLAIGYTLRAAASVFFDGDIAEIFVFSSHLTGADRTNMTDYINTKWGQTWTPV